MARVILNPNFLLPVSASVGNVTIEMDVDDAQELGLKLLVGVKMLEEAPPADDDTEVELPKEENRA